jgi:hypothetical protein
LRLRKRDGQTSVASGLGSWRHPAGGVAEPVGVEAEPAGVERNGERCDHRPGCGDLPSYFAACSHLGQKVWLVDIAEDLHAPDRLHPSKLAVLARIDLDRGGRLDGFPRLRGSISALASSTWTYRSKKSPSRSGASSSSGMTTVMVAPFRSAEEPPKGCHDWTGP